MIFMLHWHGLLDDFWLCADDWSAANGDGRLGDLWGQRTVYLAGLASSA